MSEPEMSILASQFGYDAISYGGIFRGARNKKISNMVEKAQTCLADADSKRARDVLLEAIDLCSDSHDLSYMKWVFSEIAKYEENRIPANVRSVKELDWSLIRSRPVHKISERFDGLPQSLFIIKVLSNQYGVQFYVGRKLLSELYRQAKISELHCSLVTADMLLGPLEDQRMSETSISLYFRPLHKHEKVEIMQSLLNNMSNVEITHPFPMLRPDSREELCCSSDGWEVEEDFAEQLEEGEVNLWEYSLDFLRGLNRENLRVYDPACSNGQFLEAMKMGLPHGYFIGQDLNPSMAKYARNKVDEVHCGNCLVPQVDRESIDVAFFRFLNSEIVKTDEVIPLLMAVSATVKPGGHMVIFGHTPCLLSSSELHMLPGCQVQQSVGGGKKWKGIFQFYVIKKELC